MAIQSKREVAYILKGYPRLSETFIVNEIYLLEQLGLSLRLFVLKAPDKQKSHAIVDKIRALVTYLPATASITENNFFWWLAKHMPLFAAARLRPIHGAPHAQQWLADGGRLGLVDFDGLAWGDPELDVATFLAELDFEDWETAPIAAIQQRFLAGYEAVTGPLDQRLLHAYRAHKRLSKALRNAYAVRADNDMRVERALGQALVCALQA